MKEINKKKVINSMPFAVLFIVIFILHCSIELNFGDDIYFGEIANSQGFNLISWLMERYQTWSSRSFIEALLMIMLSVHPIIWKLVDSFLIVMTTYLLVRLFCSDDRLMQKSWIAVGLTFSINFYLLHEAGWCATSLNYVWPMAFALIGFYPIKKIVCGSTFKWYEYFVYSASLVVGINSEQMCVVALFVFVTSIFAFKIIQEHIPIYIFIQTGITIVGIINVIVCPGNDLRLQNEIATWFPEYEKFTVLKKAELGISKTLADLWLSNNFWIACLVFILCVSIWLKYTNWLYRGLSFSVACANAILGYYYLAWGNGRFPFNLLSRMGVFNESTMKDLKVIIAYSCLLLLCCLVIINMYLLMGKSIKFIRVSGCFLLSLMTQAMLGFSPTIWASGERTGWIMTWGILGCIVCIIDEWQFEEKKTTALLYLFIGVTSIVGLTKIMTLII